MEYFIAVIVLALVIRSWIPGILKYALLFISILAIISISYGILTSFYSIVGYPIGVLIVSLISVWYITSEPL